MKLVNKIRKDEGMKDVQDVRAELTVQIEQAKKAQHQAEHKLQEKLDAEKKVEDENNAKALAQAKEKQAEQQRQLLLEQERAGEQKKAEEIEARLKAQRMQKEKEEAAAYAQYVASGQAKIEEHVKAKEEDAYQSLMKKTQLAQEDVGTAQENMDGEDEDEDDEQDQQVSEQVENEKENEKKQLQETNPDGEQPSNLALVATKAKKHHHHHHKGQPTQPVEEVDMGMSADMFG